MSRTHDKYSFNNTRHTVSELLHGVGAKIELQFLEYLPVEGHPVVELERVTVPRRVVVHFHQFWIVYAENFGQKYC